MNRVLRTAFGAVTTVTALCALAAPAVSSVSPADQAPLSGRVQAAGTADPANTSWGNCRPSPTHDCITRYTS
ncbi:hypothetical protein AB0F18_18815 [Streptomyces sp. NPDC029216]|uniref:hypothetical protein n=1 Tax=Streptomyces sp. NPDC029216 TaxID=3154701 RepID=UPI0033FD2185